MKTCKDCAFIGNKRHYGVTMNGKNVHPCLVLNRMTSEEAPTCEHFERPWTNIIARIEKVAKIKKIGKYLKELEQMEMEVPHVEEG